MNVFGPGLLIAHLAPIVINGFTKARGNCRIHPFTTIGIDGRNSMVAKVGDNIYLSNGCKLIGEIGDGVVVAAGAVVTKSFMEKDTMIGGIQARIIPYSLNPFP